MLSEVIFHMTVETSTTSSEFSNFIDGMNCQIVESGLVGCSAIHEDEILNLIQGPYNEMKDLIKFCSSSLAFRDLTILEWDDIDQVDYSTWQLFWENDSNETNVPVIDKKAFMKEYVLNKQRMFTPFHQVVKSVFKGQVVS